MIHRLKESGILPWIAALLTLGSMFGGIMWQLHYLETEVPIIDGRLSTIETYLIHTSKGQFIPGPVDPQIADPPPLATDPPPATPYK